MAEFKNNIRIHGTLTVDTTIITPSYIESTSTNTGVLIIRGGMAVGNNVFTRNILIDNLTLSVTTGSVTHAVFYNTGTLRFTTSTLTVEVDELARSLALI